MKLIDADALKEKAFFHEIDNVSYVEEEDIDNAPTVDAVSVVRCKDCGYWDRDAIRQNSNDFRWWNEAICKQHSLIGCNEPHEMWADADWFCADGERKEE